MSLVSEQMASYVSKVPHPRSHAGRSDEALLGTHQFLVEKEEKMGLDQALVGFPLKSSRQKTAHI